MQQEATSTQDFAVNSETLPNGNVPYSLIQQIIKSDELGSEAISSNSLEDLRLTSETTLTPINLSNRFFDDFLPSAFTRPSQTEPESFADVHICPYCTRRFKYKSNLSTHIRNKHSKLDSESNDCKFCGRRFSSKASMSFHLNKFHMPQVLKCSFCPQRFSLPVHLNAHMKIKHSNQICDFCLEPLDPANIKDHLKDSSCPVCHINVWCASIKQSHLNASPCGAKISLFQNMLASYPSLMPPPPPLARPQTMPPPPYPYSNTAPTCKGCPDCVRSPAVETLMPPETPTCNFCGATFPDMGSLGFHVGVVHMALGQNYSGIC